LAGLGIDTAIGRLDGPDPRATLEWLVADIVPAANELEATR
jgi:hypothetical protein